MKRLVFLFVVALLALTITACPEKETPTPADFSVAVEKSALSITIGEVGTNGIRVSRTGGFTDPVVLKVVNKPAGVAVAFDPNPTNSASTLTITVLNTAIAGDYQITVSGKSAGKTRFSQPFTLKIKEKPTPADFSVAVEKSSLSIIVGEVGTNNITISRKGGFADPVNLKVIKKPAGVEVEFNPNPTTLVSTLTITVSNNAIAGDYEMQVFGEAAGKTRYSHLFTLKIKDKPATPSFKLKAESVRIQKNSVLSTAIDINPKADTTIRIIRENGFDKAVRLDTEDLPDGIKATFEPNDTKADKSKLSLELTGNVAAKRYTVTVTGTSGTKTVRTTFVLIIEDKPDNIKPIIISTSPNNNDKGVKKDSKIVIEFSEAMNQAKTEAAFQLSGETVSFAWSNGGKTMTVTPDDEFDYSNSNLPKTYVFIIGSDSQDLAGNKISTFKRVKFSTYRTLSKTLYSEKALDGFVDSGGFVNTAMASMWVGDTANNKHMRGFLSFDLTELPAATLEINSVSLSIYQHALNGNPYDDLDWHKDGLDWDLMIDHVYYGTSLDADDLNADTLDSPQNLARQKSIGWKVKIENITDWVKDDFAKLNQRHSKSQYRINFPVPSDFDDSADFVWLYTSDYDNDANALRKRPHLEVTYLAP